MWIAIIDIKFATRFFSVHGGVEEAVAKERNWEGGNKRREWILMHIYYKMQWTSSAKDPKWIESSSRESALLSFDFDEESDTSGWWNRVANSTHCTQLEMIWNDEKQQRWNNNQSEMNSFTRMNALVYKWKQTLHHHKQIEDDERKKSPFINEKMAYKVWFVCWRIYVWAVHICYIDGRMKQ